MGKHGDRKVCKGCGGSRERCEFSRKQWAVGQRFCLIGKCKEQNDGRITRMRKLNKARNKERNKELNKDSERQSSKGRARNLGEYNKTHNANAVRQKMKWEVCYLRHVRRTHYWNTCPQHQYDAGKRRICKLGGLTQAQRFRRQNSNRLRQRKMSRLPRRT